MLTLRNLGEGGLRNLDPFSIDPDLGDAAPLVERFSGFDSEIGDLIDGIDAAGPSCPAGPLLLLRDAAGAGAGVGGARHGRRRDQYVRFVVGGRGLLRGLLSLFFLLRVKLCLL